MVIDSFGSYHCVLVTGEGFGPPFSQESLSVDQYDRYLTLRERVPEKYESIRRFLRDDQLSDFWLHSLFKVENLLSPYPDFDFMGKPGIRGMMGIDPKRYERAKAWLEENFDRRLTKAALIVDDFGGVPTTSLLGQEVSWDVVKFLSYAELLARTTGVPTRQVESVLDWGAGYGAQAKIYKRMGNASLTYTIADIPSVCMIQWLYLSVLFGEEEVNLITMEGEEVKEGKINIVPSSLVLNMSKEELGEPELFISTNGLNECPAEVVRTVVCEKDWYGATQLLIRANGKPVLPKDGNTENSFYFRTAAAAAFCDGKDEKGIGFDPVILIGSR